MRLGRSPASVRPRAHWRLDRRCCAALVRVGSTAVYIYQCCVAPLASVDLPRKPSLFAAARLAVCHSRPPRNDDLDELGVPSATVGYDLAFSFAVCLCAGPVPARGLAAEPPLRSFMLAALP